MRFNLTRLGALTAAGALLIALPMCARDSRSSRFNSPSTGPDEASARTALKDTPLGRVVSRDANGKARFILGAARSAPAVIDVDAETAARIHLSRHAGLLGLHEAAVHGAQVIATHRLPGGATAVQFAQSVNGVEVFRSRASVVVDDTRNLVSISSTLHAGAASTHALKAMRFAMPAETALANLYADHFGRALAPGAVRDQGPLSGGDVRNYAVQTDKGAARIGQATAKRVLYPDGDRLTPAYYIELLARAPDTRENEAGAYVLAASDGHVLYQTSLLARDAFQYRVWAESNAGNVPMDGPYADFTPHPTGVPDKIVPPLRPPNAALIAMDGFNKNPGGTADPWL
ncbi:MAG TPA: hypothetical protein VNO21_24290, partial [Polyangiaceae bacterium]|nr:hypothetical protein [Polyangiaceae bacterium]